MRILLFCAIILFSVSPIFANVINVPGEYATIQAGIDAAVNGDTVLVAPGEFAGSLFIDKNILLTSAHGPDSTFYTGAIQFGSSIDTTCKVRGFNISNIFPPTIEISGVSPIIESNKINGSLSISLDNSNAIIRGNIIDGNYTMGGSIIVANAGYPIFENNIISNNSSSITDGWVAGVGIHFDSGIIRRNLIFHNYAGTAFGAASGAGIFKDPRGGCEIYNNTIAQNSASTYRGLCYCSGVHLYLDQYDTLVVFKNNIVAFNINCGYGGGVCVYNPDSVTMDWDYNLMYGNSNPDEPFGPHDILIDPLFVDTASGNYHLLPNSPCIDAGDPSFPLDPDSTRCDIGAYFFDQTVGIDDPGPTEPYQFALSQNYPNPFNAQTTISYCLDKPATVSLRICAITGQVVANLTDRETQTAGEHRIIWDGTDRRGASVSTGIYFYELYVDGYHESKAMILIK
ncbi:MAG TPA: hypothetical protein DEO84_11465 [candidate division Zixibacteria bacterium]|nr:hypothetical protein [candidate division Zixibacteria bacterium]HBZ01925.1 hypothetical protein [candidate division Zixibacteria bacterium]